jgi:hypothetical protein
MLKQLGVHQRVVQHQVGPLQVAHGAQGDQLWVARTGAHQKDPTAL